MTHSLDVPGCSRMWLSALRSLSVKSPDSAGTAVVIYSSRIAQGKQIFENDGSQLLPLAAWGNRTAIAQEILALAYRALTQGVSILDLASRKILWEGR
jgi:hypothetical protein